MRRGKSAGKFLRRAGPHGTHDSGAVLHRCVDVEGCSECPQAVEGVGSMGEAGGRGMRRGKSGGKFLRRAGCCVASFSHVSGA